MTSRGVWSLRSWGDLATLRYGRALRGYQEKTGDYRVFGTNGPIGWNDEPLFPCGVVVGRKGAYRGIHYSASPCWVIDTAFFLDIDSPEVHSRWAYHQLRTVDLDAIDSGSAIPSTSRDAFAAIPVLLPPFPTQLKISAILDSFDDLIDNSRLRIELLEKIALSIYQEWFIRFRYPGHQGGTLVDSAVGPVPEGWTVGTVGDLCTRVRAGGTPSRSQPAYWEDAEIDWYKTGDLTDSILIHSSEQISRHALNASTARTFQPDTVLLAIYGSPTVGRLGLVREVSSANQAALGLVADPCVSSTEHLWFTLLGLRDHLNQIAQGAAQQNVSKTKVINAQAIIPPLDLVRRFTAEAGPSWRLAHRLHREIRVLTAIRDFLRPKLVTGRIDVSKLDFDALVDSVA